jgi:hypothetical protein
VQEFAAAEPKGGVTFDIFMPESNKNMIIILDSEGQMVVFDTVTVC